MYLHLNGISYFGPHYLLLNMLRVAVRQEITELVVVKTFMDLILPDMVLGGGGVMALLLLGLLPASGPICHFSFRRYLGFWFEFSG